MKPRTLFIAASFVQVAGIVVGAAVAIIGVAYGVAGAFCCLQSEREE